MSRASNIYNHSSVTEGGILEKLKQANSYYILNKTSDALLARYNEETDSIERVEKQYDLNLQTNLKQETNCACFLY